MLPQYEVTVSRWEPEPAPGRRRVYLEAPPADPIIEGPARLVDAENGGLLCLVASLDQRIPVVPLTAQLPDVQWSSTKSYGEQRLSGFTYANRVFGFTAPVALRKRYGCSAANFTTEEPILNALTCTIGIEMWRMFSELAPAEAAIHAKLTEEIHSDWHYGGAPWTSGIINRSAALPYHRDAGNLKGAWSAMLVLRKGTTGGMLHLPSLGVTLACDHRSVVIFPGQSIWHGVTPIAQTAPDGYRYTLVYYVKAGCRKCGPAADELHRAALERTARESR